MQKINRMKIIAAILVMSFLIISVSSTLTIAAPATKIKKMVIAYSNTLSTDSNRKFIASHFDVVDCGSTQYTNAKTLKSLSPNIIILGYFNAIGIYPTDSDWSYINKQESWFAHSTSGARITSSVYGYYLMNPNSGWANYFASRMNSFLVKYPQFSGVFLDNAPLNLQECGYTFPVSYTSFASGILSNWETGLISQMLKTKTAVGTKIVMPNAWKYTSISEKATKATFWENFIHGRSSAYNNAGSSTYMSLYAINALHKQAELGNIIAVNSGCKNADSYPTAAKQWQKFTLACFLMAVVDLEKAYYSWQFYNTDSSKGEFAEMSLQLGPPVADYKLLIKNTYIREFTYYYVVANLDAASSSNFNVNGIGYTLQPRNAMFIKK